MAYELLVGNHPFGRVASNQARDGNMPVPSSARLKTQEHRAIVRALDFERGGRTPSVRQFIDELNGSKARSHRQLMTVAAAAIIALAGLVLLARQWMKSTYTLPPLVTSAAPASGPQGPGSMFRDCPTCPLMTVLPTGTFDQGTPAGEGALSFEQPVHTVSIAYPLAAAVNEVTVAEFAQFDAEYPRDRLGCAVYDGEWTLQSEESWKTVARQNRAIPVSCVSWQEAVDYAAWLSLTTGETYRLPSASEWEYLARANQPAAPWGANGSEACEHGNVADQAAAQAYPGFQTFACLDSFAQSAPVGSFLPNGFGLKDTLGNVFEWTRDCWRDDYSGAPSDGSAVLEGNCDQREARGASWFTRPEFVRSTYRNRFDATYRSTALGFRLVREIRP